MLDGDSPDLSGGIGKSPKSDFLPHLLAILEEGDNTNVNGVILTARLFSGLVQKICAALVVGDWWCNGLIQQS